jgi:hypothetical protein
MEMSIETMLYAGGKVKIVTVLSLLNYAPRHRSVWGSGSLAPRILDLGTRWS